MAGTSRHTGQDCRCEVCGLDRVVESLRSQVQVVAESPAMQALLRRVSLLAETDAPVVIFGESGSGKEVIARALHANSPRRTQPFLAVNVAAVPGELLESELFGHRRGAFTGAGEDREGLLQAADRGTLFLDEIADMPLALQAKILRAVQEGEVRRVGDTRVSGVDVRFICATHRDLRARVDSGLFREDLYYRLKVLSVRVPPLRQRAEDVLALTRAFLAQENGSPPISKEAERLLLAYDWPGNVRELANAVRHGCALSRGAEVRPEHLPEELLAPRARVRAGEPVTLAEVERAHIVSVLERCGGSLQEAARVLGIGRTTLWRKLHQYGLGQASDPGPVRPGRPRPSARRR